jgi:GT2 family glycosyltransferase
MAPHAARLWAPESEVPDVALIVTSYNHAHFLAEALDSALRQTRPFAEIIVVDDGSTDDTAAVVARYPQVRYFRQENRGLAAARNSGLNQSGSELVVFLDADDLLHPTAVEAGLRCFEAHPGARFVYGSFRYIQLTGEASSVVLAKDCGQDAYLALLRDNFIAMHATVMYRRAALLAVRGFNEQLHACEDYDLYFRVARGGKVARHGAVVADYRRHGNNMSRNARLMLATSLGVLRSQWPHVRGDRERQRAYRKGVRNWQTLYGTKWAGEIAHRLRSGAPKAAVAAEICGLVTRAPYALVANQGRVYRGLARKALRKLPPRLGARLLARLDPLYAPPPGRVSMGNMRRVHPISRDFGFDRGTPVDRYYMERFLALHASDVRGRVLEIGDDSYTRRFGAGRVQVSDVLNVHPAGGSTTIVSDLAVGAGIPDDAFDCMIITQTLHLLWDVAAGVRTMLRALKPGGVLLLTVPGTVSQLDAGEWRSTWYWGFGPLAVQRLFDEIFGESRIEMMVHGNVLASTAFLQGLAAEELEPAELDEHDPRYPLLITVRAVKAGGAPYADRPGGTPQ